MHEKLLKSINDKLESLIDNSPQVNSFKRQAKVLHKKLKEEYQSKNKTDFIPLRQCQDLVAQQNGYKHWHEFHTNIKKLYVETQESALIKYDNKKVPSFNSQLKPIHIGYNAQLGAQAWLDYDSLKKHVLIQNNEDSSKLELALIDTSIKNGDHIIYMGSNSVEIEQVRQLAIQSGREKDIRTISFMTDYQKYEDTNWYFPKNLPFSSGSLAEMIVSLIDNHTMSNHMWKGYAISLISSVIMALVYLREEGEIILSFDMMAEYFSLEKVDQLYNNRQLPTHIRAALRAYLLSLPNYDFSQIKQNDIVIEHHGYIYMIIAQILGRLDSFNHLIKDGKKKEESENRFNQLYGGNENLIFLITYPNFYMATDELFSISYMMINMIRNRITNKLGASLEGNIIKERNLVKTTWIIKDCPLPKGFSIIPAQAIAAKLQLILSYKNLSDYTNENEKKSILAHVMIKCEDFKVVNNKLQYKILVDNHEENLIL